MPPEHHLLPANDTRVGDARLHEHVPWLQRVRVLHGHGVGVPHPLSEVGPSGSGDHCHHQVAVPQLSTPNPCKSYMGYTTRVRLHPVHV